MIFELNATFSKGSSCTTLNFRWKPIETAHTGNDT